ncbi:hypothetical protein ACET3Z_025577 [Daucus carota]
MYGDRNIVRFRITEERHSHKVTVWGKLAISTDAMFSERSEKPLIAILASTKLKIFKKSVQIITIPSSKVYFNLDTDILTSMRERLHADGYIVAEKVLSSQSECLSPAAPVVETISLKELGEKTSTDMLEITDVEEIANWWTYSDYDNESLQLDGKIKTILGDNIMSSGTQHQLTIRDKGLCKMMEVYFKMSSGMATLFRLGSAFELHIA